MCLYVSPLYHRVPLARKAVPAYRAQVIEVLRQREAAGAAAGAAAAEGAPPIAPEFARFESAIGPSRSLGPANSGVGSCITGPEPEPVLFTIKRGTRKVARASSPDTVRRRLLRRVR